MIQSFKQAIEESDINMDLINLSYLSDFTVKNIFIIIGNEYGEILFFEY